MFDCVKCVADHFGEHIDTPINDLKIRPLYFGVENLIESLIKLHSEENKVNAYFKILFYKDVIKNFLIKGKADSKPLKVRVNAHFNNKTFLDTFYDYSFGEYLVYLKKYIPKADHGIKLKDKWKNNFLLFF